MNTKHFPFYFLALSALISGCAPQLGVRLDAPEVVKEEREDAKLPPSVAPGAKVRIGPFMDARASDTLAYIDGREVRTEGSVGSVVQAGLERQMRDAGVRVSPLQAATIEGEVVDWRAKVSPDFPASQVVANAKVKLTLKGPKSEVLYRATYAGEANKKHPFLGESDVKGILGEAMASALDAAVRDEALVQRLR